MAKKPAPTARMASLSASQMRAAIPKIQKRLQELKALNVNDLDNETGGHILDSYSDKINATLRSIYDVDTIEYRDYSIETFKPYFGFYISGMDISLRGNLDSVRGKVSGGIAKLQTLIDLLEEEVGEESEDSTTRVLRAYNGLEIHAEIARAASSLYRDGHYSNAVEASVKALNGLVRLRSGLEFDGNTLMERAFNPSSPALRFNDLNDQSDKDEQKGFMQMFCGAVSGLRNPRAHGFINDDPERALEFIAFVSLLAKLLDEAST